MTTPLNEAQPEPDWSLFDAVVNLAACILLILIKQAAVVVAVDDFFVFIVLASSRHHQQQTGSLLTCFILLSGRPSMPHYRSYPSVCPCVPYGLQTTPCVRKHGTNLLGVVETLMIILL